MAKNRRKSYEDVIGMGEAVDGIPCSECGCRHSYVIRTAKMGSVIRRTRRCRNCGKVFFTCESA